MLSRERADRRSEIIIVIMIMISIILRELLNDRNPGDARVKVGSDRKVATSKNSPTDGVVEIGYTTIRNLSAGPLQIWSCYRGMYSHKVPYTTVGFSGLL